LAKKVKERKQMSLYNVSNSWKQVKSLFKGDLQDYLDKNSIDVIITLDDRRKIASDAKGQNYVEFIKTKLFTETDLPFDFGKLNDPERILSN
jgi:hypothetical protein